MNLRQLPQSILPPETITSKVVVSKGPPRSAILRQRSGMDMLMQSRMSIARFETERA